MAIQIGTIKSIKGIVIAKTESGSQRVLQIGDIVYDDETLIAGEFASAEITTPSGATLNIGQGSEYTLASNEENVDADVLAIQQAILAGEDPTLTQAPAAAGAEGLPGNEGVDVVQVQHLAPEVTPTSGFDTTGINTVFPEALEDTGTENDGNQGDAVIDTIPTTAGNASILLNEDDLTGGNAGGIGDDPTGPNTSGTLAFDYGLNGPGSVLFTNSGVPAGFVYTLSNGGTTLTISQNGTDVLQFTLSDSTSGNYSVTQLAPITHPNGGNENNQLFNINYQVTDADGDSALGSITLNVDDDAPIAVADNNNVTEGNNVVGNVLTNDSLGADGPAITGAVTGVAAGNNTSTAVTTGVGVAIAGSFGTLTLAADGSYTYQANPNAINTDAQDTFVYTITDADGDTSTTTLTIDIADVSLVADNVTQSVDEAALATGSNPSSNDETTSGQLNVAGTGVTYAFTSGTDGNGNNGTLTLNPDGSFSYTLTTPVDSGAVPGTNTVNGVETFSYTATDSNGNTTTGTITIDVTDDVPTATVDTGATTEGATLTVNAASGVLSNDNFGADLPNTPAVTGVAAGNYTSTAVTTGVGVAIAGSFGTLTLAADGSYTYQANPNAINADAQDTFVYTITDADGDTSTTTLTIDIADVSLVADNVTQSVDEAALATGSNPSSNDETTSGQLNVAGTGVTYAFTSGTDGNGNTQPRW